MGMTNHEENENQPEVARCGGPDDSRVMAEKQPAPVEVEEQPSRAGGPDDSRGKTK